jgi:enterochelin esterase-like enzyme
MNGDKLCGMLSRLTVAALLLASGSLVAQDRPVAVISPEILPDRHVVVRILAPKAESVRLSGSDIPGNTHGTALTKGENGLWEATMGPVDPGAYRYNFNVDGVPTIDPHNPQTSESNNNTWSLVYVPGSDFMDTRNVPHGAVAAVTYYSSVLHRFRRMHVYTPPGYEAGNMKFPIFYLLHGASDSDDSWSSVGRAGFIMDNLIAAHKAKPMVVVMPAGHTRATMVRTPAAAEEFPAEFEQDIMPFAEKNYRVMTDRPHRAIAGLSMGGMQTLNIAIPHLDQFAYVGVFSSGLIGSFPRRAPGAAADAPLVPVAPGPTWEQQHLAVLDDPATKKGLKLLWFRTGKDDGLLSTTQKTAELFTSHGFQPYFQESEGGHTWINWHNYLNEFAPQLFQ